jgi:hypothetical protein
VFQVQGSVVDSGGIDLLPSKTEKEQLRATASVCLMRLEDIELGEGDGHDGARVICPSQAAMLVGMKNEAQLLKHTWVSTVCAQAPC